MSRRAAERPTPIDICAGDRVTNQRAGTCNRDRILGSNERLEQYTAASARARDAEMCAGEGLQQVRTSS
jgi:hypothetical protein